MFRHSVVAMIVLALLAPTAAGQSSRKQARPGAAKKKSARTPRNGAKPPARGGAIVIDHARIAGATTLPEDVLQSVGRMTFFFAHASVGGNIVDGLNALHREDPARYPLAVRGTGDSPGDSPSPGVVYEYGRGNPGWRGKVDVFRKSVENGWNGRGVVAIDKFCYIDQDADVETYLQAMSDLERRHPDTVFVYATMPLMTGEDEANLQRNAFNLAVRQYVAANRKVLLDIADIEAFTPSGQAQVFEQGAQKLAAAYTSDGGHLNAEGSRRVALGVYALGAALAARETR